MLNINFKLLIVFLSVANHMSFRKAAEETNRSPPAVSMQIRQLEEQLGVALFQRTTRRMRLTAAGEALMISVRKALAELDSGFAQLQLTAGAQSGRLALACVPTIAGTRLPAVLAAFARQFPSVTVQVHELANRNLFEAVRRHDVDFGIGAVEDGANEFDFDALFDDPYCALLPPGFGAVDKGALTLRQLARGRPLLKLSSSTAFRDHIDGELRRAGLEIRTDYEFMQVSTIVAMVQAGLGVALMPAVAVPATNRLQVVRIKPALRRTIAIVSTRGDRFSPAAERFVQLCRAGLAPPGSAIARS